MPEQPLTIRARPARPDRRARRRAIAGIALTSGGADRRPAATPSTRSAAAASSCSASAADLPPNPPQGTNMNHFLPRRLLAVVFTALLGVVALSPNSRPGVGRHVRARAPVPTRTPP